MSTSSPRPTRPRRRRLPIGTWVGLTATVLLAWIGLASTGFWGMVLMVALVVLLTAVYGAVFRRTTWLRLPRKRSAASIGAGVALVVLLGSGSAYGAAHPEVVRPAPIAVPTHEATAAAAAASRTPSPRATPTPTPTPVVTTETLTATSPIPFESKTVLDASVAKGTSTITTPGKEGVKTKTWRVTKTDGVETGRVLTSDAVTQYPVAQVTTVGTYVAPPPPPAPATCTNGTYVNTAGNTVCRPEISDSAPAGATAKCGDGTYSFSQSRSGTCSRHGGVAVWL